jgi:hypothetical protein
MLVTMFNDLDHDNVASLQSAICLASILPFTQEFFDGAEPPPSTLFDCPFLFEGDLALKILPTSRVSYDENSRPPQPNCEA